MAIDRNEIEKYIFDPNNPKQCKSYKLLLSIAKKDNATFFSPEFLHYFFADQVFNQKFEEGLWDIPKNYAYLSPFEKLNLYEKNLSRQELSDFVHALNFNFDKVLKNIFIKKLVSINTIYDHDFNGMLNLKKIEKDDFDNLVKNSFLYNDYTFDDSVDEYTFPVSHEFNINFIFISNNYFNVLKFDISRSSLFITLENNAESFFEYNPSNVKPIFLKRIEDIDVLFNVLEEDVKKQNQKNFLEEQIFTIDKIKIQDFFSIENIQLENLYDKREIYIVGENGDGKTLLLQAITIALKGVKEGDVFDLVKDQNNYRLLAWDSENSEYNSNNGQVYRNLFAYGAARNNYCQMKEDHSGYLTLFKGEYDLKNPIKWLQYLDYSEQSGSEHILSTIEAKKLLQELLNSDIDIEITPDSVTFTEKGSVVPFEQLSAGYQGVITIICDLIARLSENQKVNSIVEFQGIVLIDEIELHLHPKWKYNFMKRLRDTFPLIQFIVTTHSPTVLLGASKEAVFYKVYKENGEVKLSNQIANEGYTQNSLVSSPLFDLESITSRDYDKSVSGSDYVYQKIHEVISKKLKEDIIVDEEKLFEQIDQELDKL